MRRWRELGSGRRVVLEAVDLWMVELPFHSPIVTASGVHRRRPLVLVRLAARSGGNRIDGWGECAALAGTGYDPEDAARSFRALERVLLPGLTVPGPAPRHLPPPSGLSALRKVAPATPMAFAALEMAVADAHLRAEARSFASLLGVERRRVEPGAVIGAQASPAELADRVSGLADKGYTRVKLKIGPGWDTAPLEAVSGALPRLRLQADANGAYPADALEHLAALDRFGLLCLEQPFERRDLAAHARLVARARTPVCLDEGVRSRGDIAHARSLGACSAVCLKPARLGGIGEAMAVVEDCAGSGTPVWMGGMLESGYGRGVNTALGALDGFAWPGDLSPSRTYLGADLVPPPEVRRSPATGALTVSLPVGPGMGEAPDLEEVGRFAVAHVSVQPA